MVQSPVLFTCTWTGALSQQSTRLVTLLNDCQIWCLRLVSESQMCSAKYSQQQQWITSSVSEGEMKESEVVINELKSAGIWRENSSLMEVIFSTHQKLLWHYQGGLSATDAFLTLAFPKFCMIGAVIPRFFDNGCNLVQTQTMQLYCAPQIRSFFARGAVGIICD